MGRISALNVLLFISGILLSNHCTHGQTLGIDSESVKPEAAWTFDTTTEAGVVLVNENECPSYVEAGLSYCSSLVGVDDLDVLLASPDFNVCSISFQNYACAKLDSVSDSQAFEILNCVLTDKNAIISQGAFSLFFSKFSMDKTGSILNKINHQVPASALTAQSRQFVLTAVWIKLMLVTDELTPGTLAAWTQEKMYSFIPSINTETLNCISSTPITCDGLEAIVTGLDLQYSSFSAESRAEIGMWITRFIKSRSCQKDTLANSIASYYKSFKSDMNLADFQMAFLNQDWSSALNILTEIQVKQFVESTSAFDSYASASVVLNLLESENFAYNYAFLSSLPASKYNTDVLYSLLNNILDKLNSIEDPLCKPKVKAIFQEKLSFLLIAANETTLQKFAPQDCSDFQDIYQGFDFIYGELSAELKQLVFQYRSKFLSDEAEKSGSGCTYGLNSIEWLEKNYGKSAEFASYSELIRLNKNFDGYEAISYLNTNQIIDLILETELFTAATPIDGEIRAKSLTNALQEKGYDYTKSFLKDMKINLSKRNIVIIVNIKIRFIMIEDIIKMTKPEFEKFQSSDWSSFTESLSYALPAIRSEQLADLSLNVVKDCSNLKILVGGFSFGHSYMDGNSKSEVTDWISNLLRAEPSRCISEEGDWLVDNYYSFKQDVNIATIKELNPEYNLVANIDVFTPNQLGELVMQETETRTNVEVVQQIFEVLTNGTQEQNVANLASFWDVFITEYEKAENFTNEVKYVMLQSTVTELSSSFESFTSSDTTLWFEKRLYPVMPVINEEVLNKISLEVGCGFQTSFVKAVSLVSDDILDSSKKDVLDYIQKFLQNDKQNKTEDERCTNQESSTVIYIQNSYGEYSVDTSYTEMKSYFTNFNVFESGVFQLLSNEQFGDMIVLENVYESEEKVAQVFAYLNTQTIETVDAVMTRFSETSLKNNIEITNVAAGQKLLESYSNIVKPKVATYSTSDIRSMLRIKIVIVIKFFSEDTLSMFANRDCDTHTVLVDELNQAIGKMSEKTKKEIAGWMVKNLKSPSLKGCTSGYTSTTEWVEGNFKGFFQYVSLKEVQEINAELNTLEIISETSISQKVEYLCTSTVLTDSTVTMTVLESLKGQDNVTSAQEVVTFLNEFNTAYEQLNVKTMTTEVREAAMDYLFTRYISDFNSLTVEQISSFQESFSYFIEGMTSELVQEIPVSINCNSYKSIFGGISSAYDRFSDDVKDAAFDKIISFLDYQYSSTPDVCSSLYTDSKSYVEVMFQKFSSDAKIYEFEQYYSKFDSYSCLDIFTGTQLGNLLINSTAITEQMEAAQILVELKKRDYEDVYAFVAEVDQVAQEKKITKLPNSNIEEMMFKTVWPTVIENVKTTEDYKEWFGGKLNLVISSCSASDIAALSVDIDCTSQKYVVDGFSSAYDAMDQEQRSAMYNRIRKFNKGVKDSTGSACATESGSSSEWIEYSYGAFSKEASLQDFKEDNSNFNPVSALNKCTGGQVADYAIQSGALKSEEAIIPVLESMDSPDKVKDFLEQCNTAAPEELQSSPVGKEILEKTFEVLTPVINSFQTYDWKEWTQVTLKYILHNINETELEIINYPLTCASYQELLTGLNNVYGIMTEDSRQAVYNKCIRRQFNSVVTTTGVKCGNQKENIEVWIENNFGKYSQYIEIFEYMEWNIEYKATNVINTLSPVQLANVAASAITNEEVACQVAAKVQEYDVNDANSFMDKLSSTLKEKNIKEIKNIVSIKFLTSMLSVISESLSSYSSSQWEDLMSVKLQPFIPSIDSEQLTSLLDSADCSAYKSIFQQVNNNFDKFEADTRKSLFTVLFGYINKKKTGSGFCSENVDDSSAAITNSLGKFSYYLSFSQFKEINPNFNWVNSVDILGSSQLADLSFSENVFADESKANALNGRLAQFSFSDIDAYLRAFQATAQAKNIGALQGGAIQQSIFSTIFSKVSAQFISFSVSQWNDYFGSLFSLFLPSLQVSQVELIPESISCAAFQSVVSGCSKSYGQLQGDVQTALYGKIKSFLKKSKPAIGYSCPSSGNSGEWLVTNFGELRVKASIADIFELNPTFIVMDAVSYLTASQLGTYVANNEVLSDKSKIERVMSVLNSQNIGIFLDAFNAACATNGITNINNAVVKNTFMGEAFCKAGSGFTSFNAENYTDFFENKLKLFLTSIDARALGFIPSEIGCDSLAAIMKPLIDAQSSDNPTAVFNFAESVLLQNLGSTGACTDGNIGTREWVLKYLGWFVQVASWNSIIRLKPNFDVTEVTDLLTSTQLAEASSETTIIQNITIITEVITTVSGDINSLSTFLDTLRSYIALDPNLLSNSKVKDVVLSAVAKAVLSEFNSLSVADVDSWMTKISFLLPSFNETILDFIPVDIGCLKLQTFVSYMDTAFSSLTQVKRQAVANFIKKVLSYKVEQSEDPCTSNTLSTNQWIQKNIASFCTLLTADEMANINTNLDKVSYEGYCKLGS